MTGLSMRLVSYHAGAWMYDPRIGVFLSVHPLAESYRAWNAYTYSLNNGTVQYCGE